MTKPLLYIDTNVYIDHFDGRNDYLRPLGEFAFQLLQKAGQCEFDIAISSFVIEELKHHVSEQRIFELVGGLQKLRKIFSMNHTPDDERVASRLSHIRKTSFPDTLHVILAKKMNATYVVTRNIKDFEKLSDIVPIRLPESL